ncbi:hypothetical protein CYY_000227 [Polysphondylium violaceum]|uniref:FNIP repeat-containing protein n=1 Tax=Polysphondylium violaceum TaxID=133409 RepID=A0A8J4Q534_9MYCE|nr:hypothetical protein CYY_000227 [Polysphondylium violaceum]
MKLNDSFFVLFRNCYLRTLIRNNVFRDTFINIPTLEYLNDNHKHLSVFSNDDKLKYNIFIRFKIIDYTNSLELSNHSHRHLVCAVNDIHRFLWDKEIVDFTHLHDQIHRFSFCVEQETTSIKGKLPDSIVELSVHTYSSSRFVSGALEQLLSDLPKNLRVLKLSEMFDLSSSKSKIVLPDSIVDVHYSGKSTDYDRFVVGPNKVLKSACLLLNGSVQDIDWLQDKQWINNVYIGTPVPKPIPSHVRKLDYYVGLGFGSNDVDTVLETLPAKLEWLTGNKFTSNQNQQSISTLIKQNLPCLKHLGLCRWEQDLQNDTFPDCLEYLMIDKYNGDIVAGSLPLNLKILNLVTFNQLLKIGSLPNRIENLSLRSFNQPLQASVLPTQLQSLFLPRFNSTIEPNSLPLSLTSLKISQFNGSFQGIGTLDNLRDLSISTLNQSIVDTLVNAKKIKITFKTIASNTSLTNTTITDLWLCNSKWNEATTIQDDFLPPCLSILQLDQFDIKSINTIPPSCVSFTYNYKLLNTNFIPQSVKKIILNK